MKQKRYLLIVFIVALTIHSCSISDLYKVNQYAVAYAINDKELLDGKLIDFEKTKIFAFSVTTILPSNISDSTAVCGGLIKADESINVISKGICWSTDKDLTVEENLGFTNEGQGEESFTSLISGLKDSTLYYVKAYAINETGVSYGGIHHFMTP